MRRWDFNTYDGTSPMELRGQANAFSESSFRPFLTLEVANILFLSRSSVTLILTSLQIKMLIKNRLGEKMNRNKILSSNGLDMLEE